MGVFNQEVKYLSWPLYPKPNMSKWRGEVIFFTSQLEEGGKSEKISRERGWEGGKTFSSMNWNLYDPKIQVCKINYSGNKIRLNNKNNSKNNNNEIKEII